MQRAGRNSLFTRGGRTEKCPVDIIYCMGVLLTIARYDIATHPRERDLELAG